MYSHRMYCEIVVRIGLIVLTAFGALWLLAVQHILIFAVIGLIASAAQIACLIRKLNTSNRRIQLFLDSIENEESMLVFPEHMDNSEQAVLHRAFNRINQLLAEHKRQSHKLEHFYKALLEQVPGGVISWDESGQIRLVNQAALHLLGRPFLTHIYQLEKLNPRFPELLKEAFARGSAVMQLSDGWKKHQLVISANQVVIDGETIRLLSLQDIGDSLSSKEDESWSRLTRVLTHEIMNSIAPIVSLSRTLTSYYKADGKAKPAGALSDQTVLKTLQGLEVIKTQCSHLIDFTNSYRELSFLKMPDLKPYLLRKQLDELHRFLSPQLACTDIHLAIECDPDDLLLYADESLLFQVFLNLTKNAIQALGNRSGTITISARATDRIYIEIKDNGPGIPPEILENIFVPFFTTKTEGSGIGLSLSKQIIHRHQGEIYITSQPEIETRVILILPA